LLSPAVRGALSDPALQLGGYGDIPAFRGAGRA
jgi:hypothetical protein